VDPYSVFFEFDQPGEPQCSYLVCSIPRSGSNLMCELLSATGLAGAPTELFNPDFMPILKQRWGVESNDEYLRLLLERKTGPNGVFGAKVGWGPYRAVFGDGDPRELLPNLHLVFMTRRDHLRQAVSWVRAVQSRRWQSIQTGRPDGALEFDAEHITRKLQRIGLAEEAWRSMFDRHGIEPLEIVYEDLAADQDRALRQALAFIGIEPPAELEVEPTLGRLADEISEQWVERYRAEATAEGA
jgi:LPS sulfotransferase NodH